MSYVLDASVCSAWLIPDEQTSESMTILSILAAETLTVPGHFWFEIRNVLVMCERRKRMTGKDSEFALKQLELLDFKVDTEPDETRIFALARRFGLTVYDSAYVELAERKAFPIATIDKAVLSACRSLHLPTLLY
jgi:predicted nucleic acid-binding protein